MSSRRNNDERGGSIAGYGGYWHKRFLGKASFLELSMVIYAKNSSTC
jgi:hypothetical protein